MEYVGYVYKSICLITSKVYIGITIEGIEARKKRHIRDSYNPNDHCYNVHFHRAIRKYGQDNFEWTQLECIKSDSKENLIYCLKQLEIKYISLYNSYHCGYNCTLGGDNSETTKKAVKVYLKDGTQINEFSSIQDAADYYSIKRYSVGKCCNKVQKYVRSKDFGILIFRFYNDPITESELNQAIKTKNKNSQKVSAHYKDNNEFIKSFDSIREGGEFFNINPKSITSYFGGKQSFAGVYNNRKLIWIKN